MSDYISREEVLEEEATLKGYSSLKFVLIDDIKSIPSADVRPNIHGHWEEWKGNLLSELDCKCCSNCNYVYPYIAFSYNFCPNCGADMRGGQD